MKTSFDQLATINGITLYRGDEGEPTIYDLDLAKWAGLRDAHDIRRKISKMIEGGELRPDQVFDVIDSNPGGDRIETGNATKRAYLLTEAGTLNVLVTLRTRRAAEARQHIIEVFVAWRRGDLLPAPKLLNPAEVAREKLSLIAFARQTCQGLSKDWLASLEHHCLAEGLGLEPNENEKKRQLDVGAYLTGRGHTRAEVDANASRFGKRVKAIYAQVRGTDPAKCVRKIGGADREVNAYVHEDLPIFDQAYAELFGVPSGELPS